MKGSYLISLRIEGVISAEFDLHMKELMFILLSSEDLKHELDAFVQEPVSFPLDNVSIPIIVYFKLELIRVNFYQS